jgi:hypothetical protein
MSELNPYKQQASKSIQELIQEITLLKLRIADLESENELLSGKATIDLLKPFVEQIKLEDEPMPVIHAGIKILLTKISDLESENKALRLIAGSHSMSELRRLQMQTGWFKYPPAEEK